MGLFDALNPLRLARQVLDGVLSQLTQQFDVVENMALAPIRQMVEQVSSGEWIGEGANVFTESCSNLMIPGVGRVGEEIGQISKNLTFARDVIEQADEEATRLITSRLSDVFDFC